MLLFEKNHLLSNTWSTFQGTLQNSRMRLKIMPHRIFVTVTRIQIVHIAQFRVVYLTVGSTPKKIIDILRMFADKVL